jgi:hypothetical protein
LDGLGKEGNAFFEGGLGWKEDFFGGGNFFFKKTANMML